jgi:hypothetical protein
MLKFSLVCKPRIIKQINLNCFKNITNETLIQITLQVSGANTLSKMSIPVFVITNLTTNQSNEIGWFMLRKYILILQLKSHDKT